MAILLIGFLAACGDEESDASTDNSSEENAEASEDNNEDEGTEESEDAGDQVYGVGDTVNLGDLEVTLTSASFTEPDEFMEPDNDSVLAVEFEAVNNGDEQVYLGSDEFTISSEEGTQYDEYFSGDGFMNENIGAGNNITGTILYDVPEESNYTIVYEPTFSLDSDSTTFEISPE
ncbi:DUF4352 domain-containing protein [Oceanobacillus timonensis]|uniref:DUF4352 domain-containing protein n=1 Tax=Oceanobacillus timonensis TaxID=1926285 RepID=UPI0015C4BCBE|nr:DUF4352 domain-containing protein [Oceanobacillus timonensis]